MHKFIVITSIFEPTEAVKRFAHLDDYHLVVVGDKKTPSDWHYDRVTYLSVAEQDELGFSLNTHLPYNHYCRKMLGYLYAMKKRAHIIIDTDDDNIPEANWGFPAFTGVYPRLPEQMGFVNIYELYTEQKIWPRGYPLRLLSTDRSIDRGRLADEYTRVGIWQGLANEDPDVDAIYRLMSDAACEFDNHGPHVLGTGTLTPFNSQNTAFIDKLFPLLYLPAFVTFRFTDILRGVIAQPIMWLYDYQLGFTDATVTQKRNPHDYMKDFESEIPMYLHVERVSEIIAPAISERKTIEENLFDAYDALTGEGIVKPQELSCLEAWLADCKQVQYEAAMELVH